MKLIGFVSSNISTLSEYVATYQIIFSQINAVLNEQDEGKRASALSELEKMLANQDIYHRPSQRFERRFKSGC